MRVELSIICEWKFLLPVECLQYLSVDHRQLNASSFLVAVEAALCRAEKTSSSLTPFLRFLPRFSSSLLTIIEVMKPQPPALILALGLTIICISLPGVDSVAERKVFMILVEGSPVVSYTGGIHGFPATAAADDDQLRNLRHLRKNYASFLVSTHDELLSNTFRGQSYRKLYSYYHLINGFAAELTQEQAGLLKTIPGVIHVEEDRRVRTMTTHTPEYMGLPTKCWPRLGGAQNAGDGVVIGIVDTGIDPFHPSFAAAKSSPSSSSAKSKFTGKCEVTEDFPQGSCSAKIVGAQHFAEAAIASGEFNASLHFASPLDGDGHGTHTAATAAGNNGVPVLLNGFNFGSSSGMAPKAQIAVYKALYRYIGGFFADVVAAIDQAVADGVDVLSLSVGPNGLPRRNLTFMSTFDLALLSAVKAGVFVTQAVGNGGPYPRTSLSFSPWIFSVAAATHDRTYPNTITLGRTNMSITGTGLASGTDGSFDLITAADAFTGNESRSDEEECQDVQDYDASLVEGKLIICSYSLRYLFGVSSVSDAVATAQALKAKGVVFLATPELDGHNFPPAPIGFPAIIIPNIKDTVAVLQYYNASTSRDGSGKLKSSSATAKISGGLEALFSYSAPRVATYSSRGPDVNSNSMDIAEVLKPNILAPGNLIWAAWSSLGTDEREFTGQRFAMISGTSMATPHIAGIAALVKQRYPNLSAAGIASAIATSAFTVDTNGDPLQAQHPSGNVDSISGPATPFDFGSGFVNPGGAIDPGLIFDAGFEDYVQFLCSLPSLSNSTVSAATGSFCSAAPSNSSGFASDLNTPYVSIANLNGGRSVVRRVSSVGVEDETYEGKISAPDGVSVTIRPERFNIKAGEIVRLTLDLKPDVTSSTPTFGKLVLEGNRGHKVQIPISVSYKTLQTS